MKHLLLIAGLACIAQAQPREIGFLGGGGFPSNLSVAGVSAGVSAGFGAGPSAGVLIGQDLYSRWSGEIRYLAGFREARLRSGSVVAGFSGQTHALHYDLVLHSRPRAERVRPYLAFGGGIKVYRGTGTETAYRPLMEYAYLTRTQDLKPMLSIGGGVKFRIGRRMLARIDLRDQLTRFPTKVITPARGAAISGWLHDLVPVFGLSWMF
jgi:hypothetical protein